MRDIYEGSYLTEDPDGTLRRKRPNDDLLCDFCCGPLGDTCWTYPCGDIELPLTTDPTGLPAASDDPWACCQECHPLLEAKDWNGLASRTIWQQTEGATLPGPLFELVFKQLVLHFKRFDAARTGDPYQETSPYTEH